VSKNATALTAVVSQEENLYTGSPSKPRLYLAEEGTNPATGIGNILFIYNTPPSFIILRFISTMMR
jgi:hypothetical protein